MKKATYWAPQNHKSVKNYFLNLLKKNIDMKKATYRAPQNHKSVNKLFFKFIEKK